MSDTCISDNTESVGSSNPIQSKIVINDHGAHSSGSSGDNTIQDAACDSSVSVGDVVKISGGVYVRALANSSTNSNIIGICVSKSSSVLCNVQTCGYIEGLFGGLSENTRYFLSESTPGGLTTTPPTGSGEIVLSIAVGISSTDLKIDIGPQLRRS